ncbi:MAG: hypothetical protein AB7O67_23260 [Vicinamibacterales bacterium]
MSTLYAMRKVRGIVRPAHRDQWHDLWATVTEGDYLYFSLDEAKTRDQEKGFHAMIAPWARAEGHRIEDLKRDLLGEIFGYREHVNRFTGEVTMVLREPHTSRLSKRQYSELIERSIEIAAGCNVVLIAPDEYREMHPAKYDPHRAGARRRPPIAETLQTCHDPRASAR